MNRYVDTAMNFASRCIFQPLYRAVRSDRSASYIEDVRRVMALPPEKLRAHQEERLRKIVGVALGTPWYGRTLRQAGVRSAEDVTLESLKHLPVTTKRDIRENMDMFRVNSMKAGEYIQTATGGTTESPTPLLIDKDSYYRRWAATAHFDRSIGFIPGEKKLYFWGATQDYSSNLTILQRLQNSIVQRCLFVPTSPLDEEIMKRIVYLIKQYGPRHIQSYPTPLGMLAKYMLENNISLHFSTITCCAEPLLADTRATIEAAFGQPIFNWYGAREAGRIATECSTHEGMHVNSYGLIVEVVSLPGGTYGELVLTDLFNVAMPLVRYKIGDLARLDGAACSCGSSVPRLFDVSGRTVDCFINSKGQWIAGIAFTNRFVRDSLQVKKLQIIQHGFADFEILVVPGQDFSDITFPELHRRLDDFMMQSNHVTFRIVDDILPSNSGKSIFCRRAFNPPGGVQ